MMKIIRVTSDVRHAMLALAYSNKDLKPMWKYRWYSPSYFQECLISIRKCFDAAWAFFCRLYSYDRCVAG